MGKWWIIELLNDIRYNELLNDIVRYNELLNGVGLLNYKWCRINELLNFIEYNELFNDVTKMM